jgi:membrane-bound metal-dependent hydrolase YbcI (DUF457 family)
MQTYSHLLITALAGDRLEKQGVSISKKVFLFGAILPDIALIVLTIGFVIQNRVLAPQEIPNSQLFGDVYDAYFFYHPVWIVSHNFFHAPLILVALAALGAWGASRNHRWGWPLFWLAVACALHTVIDIFTHRNDGPLLFFPFDWQTRFAAPVSYWDPRYGGRVFAPLEHLLDVVIVGYLTLTWWQRRTARRVNLSSSQL